LDERKVLLTISLTIIILVLLLLSIGIYVGLYTETLSSKKYEFYEEVPAWNMSDLAVDRIIVEPERADPHIPITFSAFIRNSGPGASDATELVFLVNDMEVGREAVSSLKPGQEVTITTNWTAEQHGSYWIAAKLEGNIRERNVENNIQTDLFRISGGPPEPELEVEFTDIESFNPIAGESYNITLNFYNPSFVSIENIPVLLRIDGEVVGENKIDYLPEGSKLNFSFRWFDIKPGEHIIQAEMDLPDNFPFADSQNLKSWYITVPESTLLYDVFEKDEWVSIGPGIITYVQDDLPSGEVGCINMIAFSPNDKNIMYAASRKGGVWKTEDGGDSWVPLTDKLLPFYIEHALIVDPTYPDIVYFGTCSSPVLSNVRIYKSIDGGKSWTAFASKIFMPSFSWDVNFQNVYKFALGYDYDGTGEFVIYAATSEGVLRYKSTNPWASSSLPNEWTIIKTGEIKDIILNPDDPDIVYASVMGEGLFYTTKGLDATKDGDWNKIVLPAITKSTGASFTFDVLWDNPICVVAAQTNPESGHHLGIYWSEWPHTSSYIPLRLVNKGETDVLYNPFVRVNPLDSNVIYFSGVELYKRYNWENDEVKIEGVHVDMHWMEWSPHEPNIYYVTCDGGIWRCKAEPYWAYMKAITDSVTHRNTDLRVTEFYDFDASQINSKLMIGGTQDCGTIMFQGTPDWNEVCGGDGAYSLIGPGDQTFYAQHQFLRDTARGDWGLISAGKSWPNATGITPNTLPLDNKWKINDQGCYITVHPKDANTVLAQGDQVYYTNDGGMTWEKRGPTDASALQGNKVKGYVSRVLVQSKLTSADWFVGTSGGQIWTTSNAGVTWDLVFYHIDPSASVRSMAFAPTNPDILYVTFDNADSYRRILRLQNSGGSWYEYWISDNLPTNINGFAKALDVTAIAGDGHSESIVYVGTEAGVFRGDFNAQSYERWTPYNEGLPLVKITDLLVDASKNLCATTYGRGAWAVITGP
jgi:photosystem II stability/assembly factor-like uncharacterized protein